MKNSGVALHIARAKQWLSRRFSVSTTEERNIRLIYSEAAWRGLVGAGASFLPVFMARLGASSMTISSLTSLPSLFLMLGSLPAGKYVEKKRNHVQIAALFRGLYFISFAILAVLPFFFDRQILPLVIVGLWCLQVVPQALMGPAVWSVLGSAIPAKQRATVNGGRLALLGVVTAVSVAAFGKLLDSGLLSFPLNYQFIFLVPVAGGLISSLLFRQIRAPDSRVHASSNQQTPRQHLLDMLSPLLKDPLFRKYVGATFFVRWSMMMPIALYSIFWVRHLDASDTVIGLRATVDAVSNIIGQYAFGRIAARYGHRNVLITCAIGLGFYPIATALVPNQYWLIPVAPLRGLFMGGLSISFFEALISIAPADRRPSYAAIQTAAASVAFFIGPFLGSLLAEILSIQLALGVAGSLSMVGGFLCWRLDVGTREPDRVDAPPTRPGRVRSQKSDEAG